MPLWRVHLDYTVIVRADNEDDAIIEAEETLATYGPNAAYAERIEDEDESPEEGEDARREEDP
jgi:hypothetical protein